MILCYCIHEGHLAVLRIQKVHAELLQVGKLWILRERLLHFEGNLITIIHGNSGDGNLFNS